MPVPVVTKSSGVNCGIHLLLRVIFQSGAYLPVPPPPGCSVRCPCREMAVAHPGHSNVENLQGGPPRDSISAIQIAPNGHYVPAMKRFDPRFRHLRWTHERYLSLSRQARRLHDRGDEGTSSHFKDDARRTSARHCIQMGTEFGISRGAAKFIFAAEAQYHPGTEGRSGCCTAQDKRRARVGSSRWSHAARGMVFLSPYLCAPPSLRGILDPPSTD